MTTLPSRLGRNGYWVGSLLVWALFLVLRQACAQQWPEAEFGLIAVTLLAQLKLMTVRLHDRDLGATHLLALLVPVLGAAWLFWQLACRRGTTGANRYGVDPRGNLVAWP